MHRDRYNILKDMSTQKLLILNVRHFVCMRDIETNVLA